MRIKTIMLLAVLLPAFSVQAGDLEVDNLTVSKDAAVYGKLDIYAITGTTTNTNSVAATGGIITTNGNYRIHTFTNNGTFDPNGSVITCQILVVAGGGGGGFNGGGGGGAGGVVETNQTVTGEISVIVGNGGIGGYYPDNMPGNGSNSSFGAIVTTGGGHGGSHCYGNGQDDATAGGSGGGGGGGTRNTGAAGTSGQGFAGGNGSGGGYGGGGGGAGTTGTNGVAGKAGNGGIGFTSSISGSSTCYGGGGGAGSYSGGTAGTGGSGGGGNGTASSPGADGTANTGGGGGGCGVAPHIGGDGGSGIVIVKYLMNQSGSSNETSVTISLSSNGINQANTSGSNVFMGKVGIGTDNPAEKLHVVGNVRVDGTSIVSAVSLGGVPITNWPSGAEGALMASSNLSDVADSAAARANLGLGSAATYDSGAFIATNGSGAQLTGITAAQIGAVGTNDGALLSANNLSELTATASDARDNLGLGSAATNEAGAFLSTTGGEVNGNVTINGSLDIQYIPPKGDLIMGSFTNQ